MSKKGEKSAAVAETGIGAIVRISLPLVAASVVAALNGFTDNFFLAKYSDAALRAALPANVFAAARNQLARSAFRHRSVLCLLPGIAAEILRFGIPLCGRTLVGYGSFFTLVALRGVGDTRAVFMSGVVVSLCVYLPGFFIVTNLVPSAAAYWAIMVATSIIGGTCNLLFLTRRSR